MASKGKRWIKLYPELLSWEWADTDGMMELWVRLLLMADQDGVVVTTETELAKKCRVSRQQMRSMLNNQISTKNITKTATKGATKSATKITICNWGKYQGCQPRAQPRAQPREQPREQPIINQEQPSIPISSPSESKHIEEEKNKETSILTNVRIDAKKDSETEIQFQNFMNWMAENWPTVWQLDQRAGSRYKFTAERFAELRSKYGRKALAKIIEAMGNNRPLLQKYNSAWLTARSWLERDSSPAPSHPKLNNESANQEWEEQ